MPKIALSRRTHHLKNTKVINKRKNVLNSAEDCIAEKVGHMKDVIDEKEECIEEFRRLHYQQGSSPENHN